MREIAQSTAADAQNLNPGTFAGSSIKSAIAAHYDNFFLEGRTTFIIDDDGTVIFPPNESSLKGYSRPRALPDPQEYEYDGEYYPDGASDEDDF
jgi:hypothetical protein